MVLVTFHLSGLTISGKVHWSWKRLTCEPNLPIASFFTWVGSCESNCFAHFCISHWIPYITPYSVPRSYKMWRTFCLHWFVIFYDDVTISNQLWIQVRIKLQVCELSCKARCELSTSAVATVAPAFLLLTSEHLSAFILWPPEAICEWSGPA